MKIIEQNQAASVKDTFLMIVLKRAALFIYIAIAAFGMSHLFAPEDTTAQPENTPSYDNSAYRVGASQLCAVETDQAGIVRSNSGVVAGHVVVVRQDGVMLRMDTSEAIDRTKSKNEADDVWVIGVCKADVENPQKPKSVRA